jgi:hypothetical protein
VKSSRSVEFSLWLMASVVCASTFRSLSSLFLFFSFLFSFSRIAMAFVVWVHGNGNGGQRLGLGE